MRRANCPNPTLMVDIQDEYNAFERLPASVRSRLAQATDDLSAISLIDKGWPEQIMLEAIEAKDNGYYKEWNAKRGRMLRDTA